MMTKEKNKNKYLLNINQDIEGQETRQQRRDEAAKFIKILDDEYISVAFRHQTIRKLSFYLDFEFVVQRLIKEYRYSDNEIIKKVVLEVHDGTVDLSDIIERQKSLEELEKKVKGSKKSS